MRNKKKKKKKMSEVFIKKQSWIILGDELKMALFFGEDEWSTMCLHK